MKEENPASPRVSQELSSTASSTRPIVEGTRAGDLPLLRAVDITKHYDGVTALAGVSFEVNTGEILALAGENGSGKSTLIKIIAGVERANKGRLFIDGAEWTERSPIERIEVGIQVIYQDFSLFPNLSAGENIWLPQQLHQRRRLVARSAGVAMGQRVLQEIGVMIQLHRSVAELPVWQKQLVAIARALVHDARLLIMDEPTTALTDREVQHLFSIIQRLATRGKSFIFVSHKLQEITQICNRVVVLRNGSKTLDASMKDLTNAQIAAAMTGREMTPGLYRRTQPNSRSVPLLAVRDFSRDGEYHDINFTLAAGEVLGFAGLMGSGRTAVVRGLFGLPPAELGTIEIDGKPIVIRNVSDAVRAGLAYVPEDRLSEGLFLDLSIDDNIVVRALERLVSKTGWISRSRRAKEAARWVDRLSIKTPSTRLPVSSLSGGNQQRVVLAKWMAANPRVLILNRPTVGVDVGSKPGIHQIIAELAARKVGVIVISDEVPELTLICDRVIVMRGGAIVAERNVSESSEKEITQIVTEVPDEKLPAP